MNLGFLSKNGRFVTHNSFQKKKACWNPYFYSVFWVRAFWAKVSKKGNFGHPPKKGKNWLIIEKPFFGYFCCFFCCCYFFFFFLFFFWCSLCFVFFRWGGPQGHLTWPLFLFCFLLLLFFVLFFMFGGFKGQVRWPKGPPHLALNPPYLFFVFFWEGSFPFFVLIEKPCFPPKKGIFFVYFQCFSFFLP